MRLFVAVDLPEASRRWAVAAGEAARERLACGRSRRRITWVPPERLHLTIVFLGEVGDEVAAAAAARLEAPLPVAPFTLRLGRLGMFPASGRPRVAWLAVSEGAAALSALHATLVSRLEGLRVGTRGPALHAASHARPVPRGRHRGRSSSAARRRSPVGPSRGPWIT